MKVICINDGLIDDGYDATHRWRIKVGEIYTVVWEGTIVAPSGFRCHGYCLLEDPDGGEYGYDADRFIPLSDIDETELINQREEVCQ